MTVSFIYWSRKHNKEFKPHVFSILIIQTVFDCGALKYDEPLAKTYREASLQYFRFTLLSEGNAPDLSAFEIGLRNALECWDEIGQHICQVCTEGHFSRW
jgi:hypothetical protein